MNETKKNEPAPPKPETKAGGVGAQVAEAQGNPAGTEVHALAKFEGQGTTMTLPNGKKVTVTKQVTRAVIPQREGETIMVKITGPIHQGKELANPGAGPKMAPAMVCDVVNILTGKLAQIIVGKVLEGELNEQYPKADYVGRAFAITMEPAAAGKRYKPVTLYEIDVT